MVENSYVAGALFNGPPAHLSVIWLIVSLPVPLEACCVQQHEEAATVSRFHRRPID